MCGAPTQGALFYDAKPTLCGALCSVTCDCTNYTVTGAVNLQPTAVSEYLKSSTQELWVRPY